MNKEELLKSLTFEQREAVENIGNKVSVTANAGSGKTTMMVTKYLYLLLFHSQEFNYKNIVAITFTKKAASEILAKIRYEINKLFKGDYNLTENQKNTLNEVNRNLMTLNVGTIHSFCRRIIRDFGYKINLQSNVTIIDEVEKEIILEKLIHEVLSSPTSDTNISSHIQNAVFYLGFKDTVETVKKMIEKKNYFDKQRGNYNRDFESFSNNLILENNTQVLKKLSPVLLEAIDNFGILKIKDENIEQFAIFHKNIISLKELLLSDSKDFELISKLAEEITLFKQGTRYQFKKIISKKNLTVWEKNYNRIYYSDATLENRYNLIKSLIAIGEKVSEDYKYYSIQNNVMDNDDTINYAVELLQNDTVKRLLRFDINYLMIDEFQDTDDRQLEIAESLSEDKSVRLFVVGDDKQSIYSFRDADVRVFKTFREKYNDNNLELNVSFRAVHHLNCFVNRYFKPIMNAENSLYDVGYQYITSSSVKGAGVEKFKEININFAYNSKHFDKSKELMTLKTIYSLLERGAKLEEICILSRSTKDLLNLSDVLKEKEIPSYVTSSSGFFGRNEIKDLIAYLQFIENPDNDLLLAATLKSALFNYSDKMLYSFRMSKKNITFWEYLKSEKKKGNDLIDDKTYEVICNSIELSNKLPITNLVMKIVDESNWNYYYNTSVSERDAVFRNLYKFMDFVRAVERRDYTNLSDLFLYLDKMFESDRMSEEFGNTSNSICMSTIHSAKGLEYKHLILLNYELQPSKSGGANRTIIDENYGPSLKTPKDIETFKNFGKSKTIIDDYIENEEKIKQKAENIRLSYVAMTRASESIDIISPLSSGSQEEVWDMFSKGMGETIKKQKKIINDKKRIEIHKEILTYDYEDLINCYDVDSKKIIKVNSKYRVNYDFSEYELSDFDFSKFIVSKEKNNKLDYFENFETVDVKERYMQFTATKLNKFIQSEASNKSVFKEIYIYGLPNIEEKLKLIRSENSNIHGISGTKFGSLFHNTMEKVTEFVNDNLGYNQDKLRELVTELYTNEKQDLIKLAFDLMNETLEKLLANNFIKSQKDILIDSMKEFELKAIFGTHIFYGEIDLLNISGDKATVWDWKTNQISSRDDLKKAANSYELQMKLYTLLVFKYNEEIQEVDTNLLFVRNIDADDENWIVKKTYKREDITNISIEISKKIGGIDSTYGHIYPIEQKGLIKE